MKRIISSLIFFILIYNLSFSENIFLNNLYTSKSSESYLEYLKEEKEVKLGHELILNKFNDEKGNSSSKRKTGNYLIIAGMSAAIIGALLVTVSMESQEVPTLSGGYVGSRTVKGHENLRTPGIVLLGAGFGMMIGGFLLRKSNNKRRDLVILSLNPFEAKAAIIYRINF